MSNLACRHEKETTFTPEKVVEKTSRTCVISTDKVNVSDAPAENSTGRTPWRYRLFGRPVTTDRRPTTAGNVKPDKKNSWTSRIFHCCRRKCRVTPAASGCEEGTLHCSRVNAVDEVVEFKAPVEEQDNKAEEKKDELPVVQAVSRTQEEQASASNGTTKQDVTPRTMTQIISSKTIRAQQDWLGFPNPAQICYMNSSLQSLFTLASFTTAISCQEEVWSSVPEAELMRRFMNVVRCHGSIDSSNKLKALKMFKSVLSIQAPEFHDHHQKDAHEFLTTVMDQLRSLSPLLQVVAGSVGISYTCPVEDHLVFKMHNTRTCKSCGGQTMREEDFTNLSLDLLPGASVQEMLQNYLMETELEFRCDCGGNASGQLPSFATLPQVLMLHVKRFSFTSFLKMKKLCDPISISRELTVTSSQAESSYSLVSIISHLGSKANAGHYISDGIYPDATLDDPDDRWLTYDDAKVTKTTGTSVCERRQRGAYVLFYQKQM